MRRAHNLLIATAIVPLQVTGCASITSGTSQVITVNTKYKEESISGATCKLENGKGIFFVTTPGTIVVHRAYADLLVTCEKLDIPEGLARVKSSTKPIVFGNILLGGLIGAEVDTGTGAAYDYPETISLQMGEEINIPALDPPPASAQSRTDLNQVSTTAGPAASNDLKNSPVAR